MFRDIKKLYMIIGFVSFAVISVLGTISMIRQINKLK